MKSRDYSQQNGKYKVADDLGNCKPIKTVSNLFEWQKYSVAEKEAKAKDSNHVMQAMHKDDPATPCGLVAKSWFNDDFGVKEEGKPNKSYFEQILEDGNKKIEIDETGIAWDTDKEYKFKNVGDYTLPTHPEDAQNPPTRELDTENKWKNVQWIDMTNGKFNKNLYFISNSHD